MTTNAEPQGWVIERIDVVQEAVLGLPPDGPVRGVLTDPYLDEYRAVVGAEPDIENALYPPLLMYATAPRHTTAQLRPFDADLRAIRDLPISGPKTTRRPDETRMWCGGPFEQCVRGSLAMRGAAKTEVTA